MKLKCYFKIYLVYIIRWHYYSVKFGGLNFKQIKIKFKYILFLVSYLRLKTLPKKMIFG